MRYLSILLVLLVGSVQAFAEGVDVPGSVVRSTFTTQIVDREPMDEVVSAKNNVPTIYYFTEIQDMSGKTIRHRWLYDGEVKAEVSFDVGGNRWRVWSSKNMMPGWTGRWTVQVVDENDQTLAEDQFNYEPVNEMETME